MSAYDNVVGGKLKLKGKALDVKSGGVKKKKKSKKQYDEVPEIKEQVNMEGMTQEQMERMLELQVECMDSLQIMLEALLQKKKPNNESDGEESSSGREGQTKTDRDIKLDIPEFNGENAESSITLTNEEEEINESDKTEGKTPNFSDHLTPAEKRYIEQREKLDVQRHSKTSKKSHRDRLNDFNQYLANLSEHYDIPKVGPG